MTEDVRREVEAVWRIESAKILATLTRTVGDLDLAEDLAGQALLEAVEQWPTSGVPRNPAAWLTPQRSARRTLCALCPRVGERRLDRRRRTVGSRPYRRRHPAADLRCVPSGSQSKSSGGVDASDCRRTDCRGDREGVADVDGDGSAAHRGRGPYSLQAGIAEYHAVAATFVDTDWKRIVLLYEALQQLAPSPVVDLNLAAAVSMAYGPVIGLEYVDKLVSAGTLSGYHVLPSVRGDLLAQVGRIDEARIELLEAARLAGNERERAVLIAKAAGLGRTQR